MRDVRLEKLAESQFNRVSRAQLEALGLSRAAIEHRSASGRLVAVEEGVFALPPVLKHDPWGRWMGATLTAHGTFLSHESATAAWGLLSDRAPVVTVTRPGCGGPRRHGGVVVFRTATLANEVTTLRGIAITTPSARCWTSPPAGVSGRSLVRYARPCGST